jgi:hypothetical protein
MYKIRTAGSSSAQRGRKTYQTVVKIATGLGITIDNLMK